MRTDAAGGHGAETGAGTEGELQENEDERGSVGNACYLVGGQCLADYRRVAYGVDLLQKIGDYYGQRKQQDGFPTGAAC